MVDYPFLSFIIFIGIPLAFFIYFFLREIRWFGDRLGCKSFIFNFIVVMLSSVHILRKLGNKLIIFTFFICWDPLLKNLCLIRLMFLFLLTHIETWQVMGTVSMFLIFVLLFIFLIFRIKPHNKFFFVYYFLDQQLFLFLKESAFIGFIGALWP